MTQEIIIDGINVAGCRLYDYGICDSEMAEDLNCDKNPDCYYKQLKQAENTVNECHKYQAELEDKITHLEQENKKLKEEIQILNKDSYTRLREMTVLDAELDEVGVMNNNYRSALEDIREMILYCEDEYNCDRCKYHDNCLIDDDKFPDFSKALINKINEVLTL